MLFRRAPKVDLTRDAYGRWLRAQRPQPLSFFLGLSEEDQEALALAGDEYVQEICLAVGFAVADPIAAEAGLDADSNADAEAQLAQRLAFVATQKFLAQERAESPQEAPALRKAPTMGGVTERRQARASQEQQRKDRGRRLFGREPDAARKEAAG